MGVGKGVGVFVGVGDDGGISASEGTSVGDGCTEIFSTDDTDGDGVAVNGERGGSGVFVGNVGGDVAGSKSSRW